MLLRSAVFVWLTTFQLNSIANVEPEVLTQYPERIDPEHHYVVYLHGKIVEGTNPRPEHPRWGVYDYPAVVDALAADTYRLIAVQRPADTNSLEYARQLAATIESYFNQGLAPTQISLVGFSKGGAIAILTANELKQDNLRTVVLAACATWLQNTNDIQAYGQFFSVYETSDRVGSCRSFVEKSSNVRQFTELDLSTGREHGAFYQPLDEWVSPVKTWLSN